MIVVKESAREKIENYFKIKKIEKSPIRIYWFDG